MECASMNEDRVAAVRARKAAAARQRRKADPERRAREAEAKRARRQAEPELRAREAAAARERRQADPEARQVDSEAARARAAAAKRARRQADPEMRAREAAVKRQRRQADPEATRTREAAAAQKRRQADPEAARAREAAAKRRKRSLPEVGGADARFKRDFLDHTFGHSCKVCDRLWFDNNLTKISTIKNEQSRANAIAVLQQEFAADDDHSEYAVCSTCKDSLVAGKLPAMSVTNGYRYPPKPEHLPELNPVEERLIAPRLPFMNIRRLTHGNGQYGIKGQVVNVPIEVQDLVQCLPRNVPEDAAIDVHIKRRLVGKASYRRGLVKKSTVHAWLKHLEQTPLYRHLDIHIDWDRLSQFDGDDAECNDDEIEPVSDITNLDDPMQVVTALNVMSHTMIYDDAATTTGETKLQGLLDGTYSLHVAPGEGKVPISLLFDEYAEELSFPQIYVGVPRQITGPRPTPFTKASSEIRRTDRRGVCPEHVLYMAMKVMRHNVSEQTMTFRTNATTSSFTRQRLESGGREFLDEVLNRDLAFMRGVPNTVQYWQDRRKELFAMIRQLGKPHAFLTLSASEIHWERLLETLERLRVGPDGRARALEELNALQRVELVNNDPVTCAIYTHRIFDVILNILKDKRCSPFRPYVVVDFFKRVEFQQRGSAHIHTILWLDNAPEEELCADMPETLAMVESLLSLDTSVLKRSRTQMHAHTHTCYKRGRTKCRFGAPFMPSKETKIVVPFPPTEDEAEKAQREDLRKRYEEMHEALERGEFGSLEEFLATFKIDSEKEYMDILRAGVARPCVLHKRTPAQKFVNAFNPWIAKVLDSNMDLQVILDHYACATYVVDYVNKADRGMSNLHKAVMQILDEKPDMDYATVIRTLGVTMLKGVEMSAQEAAWFLLRQEMSQKSRDVVYIPTCFPEERVRVRKTKDELAKLSASSTDVWKPNIVQKYEARPREMDDVCLADFASKYRRDARMLGNYVLRDRPVVIRYRHYSINNTLDDYMREQVLLYVPFRSEAVDVLDNNRYKQLYENNKELIAAKHREYNPANDDIVAELIDQHQREEEARPDPAADTVIINPQHEDADLIPSEDLVRLIKDASPCAAVRKRQDTMDRDEYTKLMRMTNAAQHELLREIIHRQTTQSALPLRVFFTGPAGCGKTFVLRLAMDVYNRYNNNTGYNAFVICASTGKAAVAVGGTTVHAAFKLSRKTKDGGLSASELNTFRVVFRHVKCVIIDEVSMMSADNLNAVDCRLRQITQKLDQPFGGLDMILCGDLRQLPPVRASEIYKRCRETGGLFGCTIKWHYLDYFPLVQVVRQADASFSALLTKIGNGRPLAEEEVRILESRFVTTEEAMLRAPSAVRLFYSNEEVNNFNTFVATHDQQHQLVRLRAQDTFLGCATQEAMHKAREKVAKMSHAEFANLPREILLVPDKPYMITANIDVIDGLVNGAVGTLKMCERGVVHEDEDAFPKRLWLQFDVPTTGKLARLRFRQAVSEAVRNGYDVENSWIPIEPRAVTLTIDRKTGVACKRRQFPLVQASAITVHKSQGGTYSSIVYEYSKTHPQKLVYVALSRCTNLDNLYLTNAARDHHFYHKEGNVDRHMVDEFQRLDKHRLVTITQQYHRAFQEDVNSETEFTIALLNTRSLKAHARDIEHDPVLTTVDVLCLTETWNAARPTINGYDAVVCTEEAERPAGGVGIYVKRPQTAVDLELPVTSQGHNGEHAAVKLSTGIVLMTMYLAPNLSKGNITKYIDKALCNYETQYKENPFVLTGDFNVDIMNDDWLVQHMVSRYALRCISYDYKHPTTVRGTCVDIAFSNFKLQPLQQEPLTLYFTDHKAVILKGKRSPELSHI